MNTLHAEWKQRANVVLRTIDELFNDHILPQDGDAKLGNIWHIENEYRILT